MTDSDIQLRNYKVGDESRIAQLLYDNFPNADSPETICKIWEWQFKKNGMHHSNIAVAELDDQIVAHYAVMCLPMNCIGKPVTGAISSATVTDKVARGRGLFTKLAGKVYSDTEKEGCEIIFGFPNSQSIKGFIRKLDWYDIGPFPVHLKVLKTSSFIERAVGKNSLSKIVARPLDIILRRSFQTNRVHKGLDLYEVQLIQNIPDKADTLWKESFIRNRIAVNRSKSYLAWRYQNKPFFQYNIYGVFSVSGEIEGYFITYMNERFGLKLLYIMEIIVKGDTPEIYRKIFNKIDQISKTSNADAVSILIMRNNPNYVLFLRNGYFPIPEKFFPQDIYFGACCNSKNINSEIIKDKTNWYISWGDLDVV